MQSHNKNDRTWWLINVVLIMAQAGLMNDGNLIERLP
jgi:hypothetical protein